MLLALRLRKIMTTSSAITQLRPIQATGSHMHHGEENIGTWLGSSTEYNPQVLSRDPIVGFSGSVAPSKQSHAIAIAARAILFTGIKHSYVVVTHLHSPKNVTIGSK
jgi:hypothetical protein